MKAIPICDQNCQSNCRQCQSCLQNCPTGALRFEAGFPVVNSSKCRGMTCMLCVTYCPHNALKLVLDDYAED